MPSGDCFVLSTSISNSVLRHCANAAVVMTRTVLTVIQRQKIDMNIVAYSIWWWKLPPTTVINRFLKEFSKDEKNAKDIYKLFKISISWKVSGVCFSYFLFFFLWNMEFVFKTTLSWETAEYLILLVQVCKMSHLQLLVSLPSLFLSHSETLLFLPTLYFLIQGDSL